MTNLIGMDYKDDVLVSVIIPCYNVEDYIEECIFSVLSQTYTNIEIFCVDDGSKDDTVLKIKNVQKNYGDKIRLTEQPKSGAPAARNTGLRYANGEYIQFLDADDLLMPLKIAHQVEIFHNDDIDANFIVANSIRQYPTGEKVLVDIDKRGEWFGLATSRLGNTCANLWKKKALMDIGGWNEELQSGQEYDLMFRLLQRNHKVLYDTKPLTIIRKRSNGSISQTNKNENHVRYINLRLKMLEYIRGNHIKTEELEKQIYDIIFKNIQQLYRYSKEDGVKMHNEVIPKSFRLDDSSINYYYYRILYLIFGFEVAQKVWSVHMKFKKIIYHLTKERVES